MFLKLVEATSNSLIHNVTQSNQSTNKQNMYCQKKLLIEIIYKIHFLKIN
jgi:hypothetical protein